MPSHDPCPQDPMIRHIAFSLEAVERGQEKIVEALGKLAAQDARIDHLEDAAADTKANFNEVFARIREVEQLVGRDGAGIKLGVRESLDTINERLEKITGFIDVLTSRPAISIAVALAVMTMVGTVCDMAYHYDLVKAIIKWIPAG